MHPSGAKYEGTFTHRNDRHYRHDTGRMECLMEIGTRVDGDTTKGTVKE
jgi:hypothetical protein